MSNWFSGKHRPDLDSALRMARALGVPLDYLADDEQDSPPAPDELPDDEQHLLRVYRNLKRTGALDEDQAVTGLVALAQTGGRLWGPPPGYEHGVGRVIADVDETEAHLRREREERDRAEDEARRKAWEKRQGRSSGPGRGRAGGDRKAEGGK